MEIGTFFSILTTQKDFFNLMAGDGVLKERLGMAVFQVGICIPTSNWRDFIMLTNTDKMCSFLSTKPYPHEGDAKCKPMECLPLRNGMFEI